MLSLSKHEAARSADSSSFDKLRMWNIIPMTFPFLSLSRLGGRGVG